MISNEERDREIERIAIHLKNIREHQLETSEGTIPNISMEDFSKTEPYDNAKMQEAIVTLTETYIKSLRDDKYNSLGEL